MQKVLIIEDEADLNRVLRSYLERAGFQVISSYRGDEGLSLFDQQNPDLILLDLNLPGVDGIDVARQIRRKSEVPIIMITARVDETDRLIGLELGADDYIIKPYSPREVVARVRAVLRRARNSQNPLIQKIRLADLEIDSEYHVVTLHNQTVDLTPTEFILLQTLATQPGRVFTRLQLLEATQGTAYEGYERTVDAHIKNLRAKLYLIDPKSSYVETVFGVGYRIRKDLETCPI